MYELCDVRPGHLSASMRACRRSVPLLVLGTPNYGSLLTGVYHLIFKVECIDNSVRTPSGYHCTECSIDRGIDKDKGDRRGGDWMIDRLTS